MSLDVERELSALCRALDEAAPSVSIDEIISRRDLNMPSQPAPATGGVAPTDERRRRQVRGVSVGLVAAAVLATVFVVGNQARLRTVSTTPSAPTMVSEPSVASPISGADTTAPPASTNPGTQAPTTTMTPSSALSVPALQRRVDQALSSLDSFRATATIIQDVDVQTTAVNTVTMLSDGRMWASTAGGWASYDSSTGVSKLMSTRPGGDVVYQEIVGWADNSVGIGILVGHDPVLNFDRIAADADIIEVIHDGRPAWRIRSSAEVGGPDPLDDQIESIVIDQATGLVVATRTELIADGVVEVTESSLTGLEADVTLPAEYPGTFPDGATVEHSGDPNAFRLTAIVEAAALFGRGFLVPADLPAAARVTTSATPVSSDTGAEFATDVGVTITIPDGFTRTTIELHKFVPVDGVTPGFGMIPVDDALCFSPNGIDCNRPEGTSMIADGALAGHNLHVEGDGSMVSVNTGPVVVTVHTGSFEEALDVVHSLVDRTPTSDG